MRRRLKNLIKYSKQRLWSIAFGQIRSPFLGRTDKPFKLLKFASFNAWKEVIFQYGVAFSLKLKRFEASLSFRLWISFNLSVFNLVRPFQTTFCSSCSFESIDYEGLWNASSSMWFVECFEVATGQISVFTALKQFQLRL